jgi:transcriptional regulator
MSWLWLFRALGVGHWTLELRSALAFLRRARLARRVFRKDLIPLLLGNPMSVAQVGRVVGEKPSDIEADLVHLLKSLKHTEYTAVIESARCRKCGFEFEASKLAKPSKCPKCRSTWILEPRVALNESG